MLNIVMLVFAINAELFSPGVAYTPTELSVVDGDTLKVDGINVRISNLDTPERGGRADCDAERFLATVATQRAKELVKANEVLIWPEGRSDRYKRPLVRVTVNGADWAEILIEESLAVKWAGRQHDWCKLN